jgi:LemA protein
LPNIYFIFGGIFGLTLVIGLAGIFYYNKLTSLKVKMEESLRTLDVLLDRRQGQLQLVADLLKRLGLPAFQEAEIALDQGKRAMEADNVPGKAIGLQKSEDALRKVLALAEQEENMVKNPDYDPLQRGMEKTNIEIDGARRYYNALVREYNLLVQRFPSALYALLLRQQKADFLDS